MEEIQTIAVLSDNGRLAETLRLGFEDQGFSVIQMRGVERDVQILRAAKVNLLIIDLDTSVWEIGFVKEVKRVRPLLPIVLLSSFEENVTRFLFTQVKIEKTFVKPFDLDQFSDAIRTILKAHA